MFQIDDRQIKQLENELKGFKDRALPFATKATVNRAAFETRKVAQTTIREDMVNRNRFTVQSIQVDQARTLKIQQQAAAVGSIADYMEVQEFGGVKSSPALPTGYSAGQEGSQPRTRLPRKPNKLANIKLAKRSKKGTSRRQRNFTAVKAAAQSGQKYVYLDMGRTKAIFRVVGGKRKPRLKMVHNLSRQSVTIPRNPWLAPAVAAVEPKMQQFYGEALRFQLKRHGLLRG